MPSAPLSKPQPALSEPDIADLALLGGAEALPPEQSFVLGVTPVQKKLGKGIFAGFGIGVLLWPAGFVSGALWAFWGVFFALICWRLGLILLGQGALRRTIQASAPPQVDDEILPVYSVLVPLYDEADVVDQLAASLSELDWPEDKLDILLLLEAEDFETRRAVQTAALPPHARAIIVPKVPPQTKPKALNFGLAQARGELVCIFDAEDRPHPQQLRAAHAAFVAQGENTACVQAALVADNGHEAWIASQWGLDYAIQFGLLVPAMARAGVPIALGGTSNHFRRSHLDKVGGWDAYNVTEDADLGLRFAAEGYRVGTCASYTLEDAPNDWIIWHRQRGRWIKGFVQTWLVLMRQPAALLHRLGIARLIAVQLSLGGAILAPLVHAPMMVFVLAALMIDPAALGPWGGALLGLGVMTGLLGDCLAPGCWGWHRAFAVLTRPFYWPLHTLAAFEALYDLAVRPHFWAKTPHRPHQE